YIKRRQIGNHTNKKPFNGRQKRTTMIKYSRVWDPDNQLRLADPRTKGNQTRSSGRGRNDTEN
ncbi:hypothetical protein K469DRAFT_605171, partial [Zopfia rhizophila CBS 207.26]